jgi:flagellum-specific ATP synthase
MLSTIENFIENTSAVQIIGTVSAVQGLVVEVQGIAGFLSIGSFCIVEKRTGEMVRCEVVAFHHKTALLLPFSSTEGIGPGCKVIVEKQSFTVFPHQEWQGRIMNAFAESIDHKGFLPQGKTAYSLQSSPPPSYQRQMVGEKIDLGVRSLNTFVSCCLGQRIGIFSGSGVGKSVLLSMIARFSAFDCIVIGLVGERGREVQEFIVNDLGEEGLKRSVMVVATSDESPLMRRQAAFLTLTIAEYFRDQGKKVLCMMDSVTRFAMAQREIGLSAGEPMATKGYTPTVFSAIPKLLERAGPGTGEGSITALFTVLVEGDDMNEPVADTVRGTLDGHIILSRTIAERGRYPAVDILKSVSRMMPQCNTPQQNYIIRSSRQLLSTYEDMSEMVRLGAYKKGTDLQVDRALHYYPLLEEFLNQDKDTPHPLSSSYKELARLLDMHWEEEV